MAEQFNADEMDGLLLLASRETSLGYDGKGDFYLDDASRLVRIGMRDTAPFVYAGVQIVHPRLFADKPAEPFSTNIVWDEAIARGRLYGIDLKGLWMHVGTPDAVTDAERRLADPSSIGSPPPTS